MSTAMFVLDPNGPLAQPISPPRFKPRVPIIRAGGAVLSASKPPIRLPNEILYYIAGEHLVNLDASVDFTTIKALSLAHSIFQKACRKILFRAVTFNLRRRNIVQRILDFNEILPDAVVNEIRHISIQDNCLTPGMKNNEQELPFHDAHGDDDYTHLEMLDDKRYELLFCDEENSLGHIFCQTLRRLRFLNKVEINIFYQHIGWSEMSYSFQSALCNLIVPQSLTTLSLQGLKGLPRSILGRFKSLRALELIDCTMGEDIDVNLFLYPELQTDRQRSRSVRRLQSLTLRDMYGDLFSRLLQSWVASSESTDYVDMAHPEHVEIIFLDGRVEDVQAVLGTASKSLQSLKLHTMGLGVSQFLPDLIMSEDEIQIDHVVHPVDWFDYCMLVQPSDIEHMAQLWKLELSVSFWEPDLEADDELDWALRLIKHASFRSMREIVLTIKIGGFPKEDSFAVRCFNEGQRGKGHIWESWVDELRKEKWNKLELFSVRFLAPRLAGSPGNHITETVELATARLSPAFEERSCHLDISLDTF